MAKGRKPNTPIDGKKLEKEIKQRNLTGKDASVAIGKSHDYIRSCIRDENMSEKCLELISKKLFITYEDIMPELDAEPKQDEAPEEVQEPAQVEMQTRVEPTTAEIEKAFNDVAMALGALADLILEGRKPM